MLAKEASTPILPVAHDAGRLWPRQSFLKHPGIISLHIGQPISTEELSPEQIRKQYANWLQETREKIKQNLAN